MKKLNQRGAASLLIPLILVMIMLLAAAGFGGWAYMSRQDYKDNSDKKVATAVDAAKKDEATLKDAEFVEKEKQPLRSYNGSAAYGSVNLSYPKTWSAYVSESDSSTPIDAYLHPSFVPGIQSQTAFALRLQVVSTAYSQTLAQYDSPTKSGEVKASPFKFPKVGSVTGVRLDGTIAQGKTGSMVIVPLRDKTLKIWTEANQYVGDFNNNILPNLTFVP